MTTYNGWTNYETWRVNLEIFDGMTVQDLCGRSLPTVSEIKDACKEYAEEIIEQSSQEGLARDYAFAFLSNVDWYSIADHIISYSEEFENE